MSDEDNGPDGDAAAWIRVVISVDPMADLNAVEVVSGLLWAAGVAGVEEQETEAGTILIGGFPDPAGALRAMERARALGFAVRSEAIVDDGLDGWRAWAAPERAGRFWITPSWVEAPGLGAGEEILWIDPGPTFGSGSHPTTRLVLALLQDLVEPGTSVLDAGCGSGVLAVGAARCGATSVVAIDIDPSAPETTMANALRNDVAGAVHASSEAIASVADRGTPFDGVAANLLAPVIVEHGADLVRCVAPGGWLVVSGLLADRWEATMPSLGPLAVERVADEQGWVAVLLR